MFSSIWSALFGGMFGRKKKPTEPGYEKLPWKTGAPSGSEATFLGGGPAAAPAAKALGMFTERGTTYGEEALKLPREERMALDPEEVARRRKAFKPGRSRRVAKRRETLLTGAPKVKTGGFFLGA